MKSFTKVIAVLFLSIYCLTYSVQIALAASPTPSQNTTVDDGQGTGLDMGTSISPVKFIFDVNKGETVTGEMTVYNVTNKAIYLYPYTMNFTSDGSSGIPKFITETKPYNESLKDWITFEKEKFDVENVKKNNTNATKIKFNINVPKDAEFGGHYAAIMISVNDPKKQLVPEGGNVAFSADPGSLILLNVKGKVTRDLELKGFYATDPFLKEKNDQWLFEWMPVEFSTLIKNSGNTHATPLGNIIVYQGDKEVQKLAFNDGQSAILRESNRTYSTIMESGFIFNEATKTDTGSISVDTNGNTQTKLSVNWDKIGKQYLGPYKAKLLLVYDDEGQKKTIMAEKDFWILPWKLILVILLVIGGYIFVKVKLKNKK